MGEEEKSNDGKWRGEGIRAEKGEERERGKLEGKWGGGGRGENGKNRDRGKVKGEVRGEKGK